jgi:hypothetical protein
MVQLSPAREFFRIKSNGIELSTDYIREENLIQSAFLQDNNLKHKYTLELLTKTTLNVPEWPTIATVLT